MTGTWATRQGIVRLDPAAAPVSAADWVAVTDLLHRYAIAYDERQEDALAACFTEDAICETWLRDQRMSHFEGASGIAAGMVSVMGEQGTAQRRHLIGNITLTRHGSDIAGTAYSSVLLIEDPSEVLVAASAVYSLAARIEQERFRFSRLIIGLDGYRGSAPRR